MLAPPEPANIQPELTVEDDFVDEFRQEQQQELQFEHDDEMGGVEDTAEESRGEEEVGEEEEEEEEKEIEEETKEQEKYEDMSHEQNIRVHLPGRDKRPVGELTPVSVGPV